MSTQTITEFLEARIAEDEAVARRVADGPGEPGGRGIWSVAIGVSGNDAKFAHVASDPARVLAECAAKRAVVELHPVYIYTDEEPGFEMELSDHVCPIGVPSPVVGPCKTLRALAAVYADHEDYRNGWAL